MRVWALKGSITLLKQHRQSTNTTIFSLKIEEILWKNADL